MAPENAGTVCSSRKRGNEIDEEKDNLCNWKCRKIKRNP